MASPLLMAFFGSSQAKAGDTGGLDPVGRGVGGRGEADVVAGHLLDVCIVRFVNFTYKWESNWKGS